MSRVFAIPPSRDHALGVIDHRIARKPLIRCSMKRGLGETTLPLPFFAFAGQQTVADQALKERRAQ